MDRKKAAARPELAAVISRAIEVSDFFVACLSREAIQKKGQFQAELRYALDCASCMPLDDIYLIPVRLEECPVPICISRELQYVDLFPDWEAGVQRLFTAVKRPNKTFLSWRGSRL